MIVIAMKVEVEVAMQKHTYTNANSSLSLAYFRTLSTTANSNLKCNRLSIPNSPRALRRTSRACAAACLVDPRMRSDRSNSIPVRWFVFLVVQIAECRGHNHTPETGTASACCNVPRFINESAGEPKLAAQRDRSSFTRASKQWTNNGRPFNGSQ